MTFPDLENLSVGNLGSSWEARVNLSVLCQHQPNIKVSKQESNFNLGIMCRVMTIEITRLRERAITAVNWTYISYFRKLDLNFL